MNRYVMCRMRGGVFSFLLEEDKAVEIHCDSESEESLLGNIYVGRIRDIAENIGAAFVEISSDTVCYLPISDLRHPIYTRKGSSKKPQQGDELLVQVSREKIKTKYPAVTTNLTFYGKYVLLTTGNTQLSVSSKLEKAEKQRLTALAAAIDEELRSGLQPDGMLTAGGGWLIRTNAQGAGAAVLRADMERLLVQYRRLMDQAAYRVRYTCLMRRPPAWIARLTDLYGSSSLHGSAVNAAGTFARCVRVEQYLTDDENIWREADAYLLANQPEDREKLSFYRDEMQPLCKHFSLERQLEQALAERVWLNSGGYLVIQPTEALTVIDVNTGKCDSGKNKEAAFFKINREAAAEAARQIRLRNLSGIILIDFINMDSEENKQRLLRYLDDLLQTDPVRTALVDMTKLSLVEITRMKKERPLREACQLIAAG